MSTVVTVGSPNSFQFSVIDFANPANPVSIKPSFQDPCQVNQDGAIAYVGNLNGGQVQRFDISTPAQPVPQGTAPTVLAGINSIAIRGTLVAAGEETNIFKARICLIDFSSPNQPTILGYAQTPLVSVTGKDNLPAISQLAFIGPNHVVASGPA